MKRVVISFLLIIIAVITGSILYFSVQSFVNSKEKESQFVYEEEISKPELTPERKKQLEKTRNATALPMKEATSSPTVQPTVVPSKKVKVKGIYVTGAKAGIDAYMEELIELVETTELNAMVIDIKNDSGEITYKMDSKLAIEIGATVNYIPNIQQLVQTLKEKGIYVIARIVAFKDPILAEKKPELSLKKKDGTIIRDQAGLSWVNPYNKLVWDYLVEIGGKAAELGFDEVQYDYIRFSTDASMKEVDFGVEAEEISKIEIITQFTNYIYDNLKPLGIFVSADVYGAIIDSEVDANIVGQSYVEMSKNLDYICPMIYPSHYADGSYGVQYPDLEPYPIILNALKNSREALKKIEKTEKKADVRAWLQDFTASWLANYKIYGSTELKEQIQAVYDAGYEEWILWNGSNHYTKTGLRKVDIDD